MANYYLRHGEYPAYAATPTGGSWPLDAQDGDGLLPGIAVSATASIDCAGVTATAGNALTVMGAVLNCVASGAGASQFNAGTGASLATAIAAAINAATATVNASTAPGTAQLRDMVFARVNPGVSTQVQLMTRVGSATLNHAGNSSVAIAVAGFAPTLSQFAGGVSGAWGYLTNSTPAGESTFPTIWPSAKPTNTYGCAYVSSSDRPLVGPTVTIDDVVNARGNGAVVSSGTSWMGAVINITAQINLLVDDGTIWPGATGAFTLRGEAGSGSADFQIGFNTGGGTPQRPVTLAAKTPNKLVFEQAASSGNDGRMIVGTGGGVYGALILSNALFVENTPSAYSRIGIGQSTNANVKYLNCHFKYTRNYFYPVNLIYNSSGYFRCEFIGCKFEWTALATAAGALFNAGYPETQWLIKFVNCEAIGASPRVASCSGAQDNLYLSARNMRGFSLSTTLLGYLGSTNDIREERAYAYYQNVGADRGMRVESNCSVLDWVPAAGYPTLSAVLPSGTPWAYRLLLSAAENAARHGGHIELVALTKTYEAADAPATLTLETLVPSAHAAGITVGHLGMTVAYTDTNGLSRYEQINWSVFPRLETAPLSTSAAVWTLNSYGGHVARKISLTTAYAIKQNTEIEVLLYQRRAMPAQVEVFVNPEVSIA